MSSVGKSVRRIDAFDKVTGRTKYYEDMIPQNTLYIRIKHSDIAHGKVLSVDTSKAEKIPGVVKVLTCFDVPDIPFPTAGHPWSMDPEHQDVADRHLLTKHVRFYGDDVAVVIAENEVAAKQGVAAIDVEYEELPFVLDVMDAMKDGAPQIHEKYKNNILSYITNKVGDYESESKRPGLVKVEGWYELPTVQHCHIENFGCFAYVENGRVNVVTSTQIPHIVRRVVGQALGRPWADVRIVKAYVGGGFGNKQDVLYEPLCAWCSTQVGGRPVRIDCSREETFVCNRVRHAMKIHMISWLEKSGKIAARKVEVYSDQGGYASHGRTVCGKTIDSFNQKYHTENFEIHGYTVFTNKPVAGAMRGYGIPQATFADESHTEDCAKAVCMSPLEYRDKFILPKDFVDEVSGNKNYFDSYRQCLDKGKQVFDYDKKVDECKKYTGNIRRGVGVASFWYNTGVYPHAIEISSNRMQLNLDGTVTMQYGETEIGQGADTALSQMAADVLGLKDHTCVHVVSCQDTDVTPTGFGAYASRQTYMAGFSITQTAEMLKDKIFDYVQELTGQDKQNLDISDSNVVNAKDGSVIMSLEELAKTAQYNIAHSEHITAENTYTIKNNAYSLGCTFAYVEVDVALCKVTVKDILNVHDCGKLINPALAEAQVHGGMSMAIGYGLAEQLIFDEKTGKPLNNNLLDYKLSTFMDHPRLNCEFIENAEPTSPFGTKALGEPPTCSPAAAIRNAVYHATGVAINKLPLNQHCVFEEFTKHGLLNNKKEN